MRLNLIRAVFFKELREMLRDRRSLAVMFGLPLVLYPLLAIGIATLGSNKKKELTERSAKVAITDPAAAPHLQEQLEKEGSGVELVAVAKDQDLRQMLLRGEIDAAVEVPAGTEKHAQEGAP